MVKKAQWKALSPRCFQKIRYDYLYPYNSDMLPIGNQQYQAFFRNSFRTSRDLTQTTKLIDYLSFAEYFLKMIQQSESLPFTIDKSFKGFKVIRENELGRLFYNLLKLQNGCDQPEYAFRNFHKNQLFMIYESSEAEKLIEEIGYGLGLDAVTFTGNPSSIISEPGYRISPGIFDQVLRGAEQDVIASTPSLASGKQMLEGDLINTFVIRLRERVRSDSFIAVSNSRKASSKNKSDQSVKYVKQLYKKDPNLSTIRLLLFHDPSFGWMPLSDSDQQFRRFLKTLDSQKKSSGLLGWWWKRGYMNETGFYYHLIFFHSSSSDREQAFQNYLNQWLNFTECKRIGCIPFVGEWLIQDLYRNFHFDEVVQLRQDDTQISTITSIKRMFKCEDAWRLNEKLDGHEKPFTHFEMDSISLL